MNKKPNSTFDADKFREWLLIRSTDRKVTNDIISRCRKVEATLKVDLIAETQNEMKYVNLMKAIGDYASETTKDTKSLYASRGCLRFAVKQFAIFHWGKQAEEYPKNYGISG